MKWAAKLYPRPWRERYGAEFDALLNDVQPRWSDLFDVLRGAGVMHMRALSHLKLAGVVALIGLLVGYAVSFYELPPYESSAIVRVLPDKSEKTTADPRLPDSLNRAWQEVTSRGSLSEIIKRPSFDLYPSERNRMPLEEVVAIMRRNIRVEKFDTTGGDADYRVSFVYPDRSKVRLVTDELTTEMVHNSKGMYDRGWNLGLPAGSKILVVHGASSPQAPLPRDRLGFLAWGLGLGMLFGVVAASFRWRAKWTLQVIGCGFAGWLVTFAAVTWLFIQRDQLPGCRYRSSAIIALSMPQQARLITDAQLAGWLRGREAILLSDAQLAETAQRVDRYRKERTPMPLNAEVAELRKGLAFHPLSGRSAISISFTHQDRFRAQQVVSAVVMELVDANQRRARQQFAASSPQDPARAESLTMDLLEPASLPNRVFPSLESLALTSMAIWMLLGGYVFRDRNRGGPAISCPIPSSDSLPKSSNDPLDDPHRFLTVAPQ